MLVDPVLAEGEGVYPVAGVLPIEGVLPLGEGGEDDVPAHSITITINAKVTTVCVN